MDDLLVPALRMARIERASSGPEFTYTTPASLYHLADGDQELYIHAMRESGFILVDGVAENPCGICGHQHPETKGG